MNSWSSILRSVLMRCMFRAIPGPPIPYTMSNDPFPGTMRPERHADHSALAKNWQSSGIRSD